MSFISRLFGSSQRQVERKVHDTFVHVLVTLCGCTPTEARKEVSNAIALCKQQGRDQGTADLSGDFGDHMIEAARAGEPLAKWIVDKARREGATDHDVKEWWNLPDLVRRMTIFSESVWRFSVFCHAQEDDGLSPEDAAARVHNMFPKYGDPEDTSTRAGEDRPLPHELRGRIDSYRQTYGAEHIADHVKGFSSYNAFVRHAIKNGLM